MYYSHGTLVGLDDFTNLYDVIKIFNIIIIHFELDISLSSMHYMVTDLQYKNK